eukprot:5071251-Pyramimonas_sp.AAC.2
MATFRGDTVGSKIGIARRDSNSPAGPTEADPQLALSSPLVVSCRPLELVSVPTFLGSPLPAPPNTDPFAVTFRSSGPAVAPAPAPA